MVARPHVAWVRAAAVGLLSAWLPCMPLGLCVRAPEERTRHGCCPRQSPVKMAAAPQQCWLQEPAPLPAGPVPPVTSAPGAAIAHARPVTPPALMQDARPNTFSPLAIVLRI